MSVQSLLLLKSPDVLNSPIVKGWISSVVKTVYMYTNYVIRLVFPEEEKLPIKQRVATLENCRNCIENLRLKIVDRKLCEIEKKMLDWLKATEENGVISPEVNMASGVGAPSDPDLLNERVRHILDKHPVGDKNLHRMSRFQKVRIRIMCMYRAFKLECCCHRYLARS